MKNKPEDAIDDQPNADDAKAAREEAAPNDGADPDASASDELEIQNAELTDKLRRAMADLANFRKRQVKDLDDARKRAIEGLTTELLPVLDNFHLALAAQQQQTDARIADELKAMLDGLSMVRSLLEGTLERHGLAEIRAEGEVFDPNKHEAVGVDSDREADAGRVTRVALRGYTLGDKVLRPARVFVAGTADDATRGESSPDDGTTPDA